MEALKVYKLLLLLFQFINCLVALGLVYVGASLIQHLNDDEVFTGTRDVAGPAAATIIAGLILFAVGVIGTIGAVKESPVALAVFCVLQLVALVMELTGGAIAVTYRERARDHIHNEFQSNMIKWSGDEKVQSQINNTQTDFQCCGTTGPDSWTCLNLSIPDSCCAHPNYTAISTAARCPVDKSYTEGCVSSLFSLLNKNLIPIAAVTITFALVQLFSVVFGVLMYRKKRREIRYQEMAQMV